MKKVFIIVSDSRYVVAVKNGKPFLRSPSGGPIDLNTAEGQRRIYSDWRRGGELITPYYFREKTEATEYMIFLSPSKNLGLEIIEVEFGTRVCIPF